MSARRPLTYLACPYSHPDREMEEARYRVVTRAAAWLIKEKKFTVFSPITHSHPLREIGQLSGDWKFWAPQDYDFLRVSCQLVVLQLEGWDLSTGVRAEINKAIETRMPIYLMKPTMARKSYVGEATYGFSFGRCANPSLLFP